MLTDPWFLLAATGLLGLLAILALALLPGTPAFRQIVIGVKASPAVVGLMRAALVYLLPVTIGGGIAYVQEWTSPALLPLIPILVALLRIVESQMDQRLRPGQNSVNPSAVAGGGDADLLEP